MTCPKCNSDIPAKSRFCANCGHSLNEPYSPPSIAPLWAYASAIVALLLAAYVVYGLVSNPGPKTPLPVSARGRYFSSESLSGSLAQDLKPGNLTKSQQLYLIGAYDLAQDLGQSCARGGTTTPVLLEKIYSDYVAIHPASADQSGASVAAEAFGQYWPCQKQQSTVSANVAPPSPEPPQPQAHVVPITNGALTIAAGGLSWYPFTVPASVTSPGLVGRFTATGGSGNDIKVYIVDEDGFVNLRNGHQARTYYDSGQVTQAEIQNALPPNQPGTYYLVFDNRFSPISPKAVQVNVTLRYMQ